MESCSTLISVAASVITPGFVARCGEVDSDVEEPRTPLAVVETHEDDVGKVDHF
jgi:hypothetical protein